MRKKSHNSVLFLQTGCFLSVLGVRCVAHLPRIGKYMEEVHILDIQPLNADYSVASDGNPERSSPSRYIT